MRFNKICRHNVDYERTIPYNMFSFIGIVRTYFDLSIIVTQRIKFIVKTIDTDYHHYFGKIPYENVILGITIFVVNEFNKRYNNDSPPFDVSKFVICLYGEERSDQNITQIYSVTKSVEYLFT